MRKHGFSSHKSALSHSPRQPVHPDLATAKGPNTGSWLWAQGPGHEEYSRAHFFCYWSQFWTLPRVVFLCLCLYPCSGLHPGLPLSFLGASDQPLIHLFLLQKVDTHSRHLTLTSEMAILIHTHTLQIREQEVGSFSDALVEPSETCGKWSAGEYLWHLV